MNGQLELLTDEGFATGSGEVICWAAKGGESASLRATVDPFLSGFGPVAGPAIDLVRIAFAALTADRRLRRPASWSRTISLRVHVTRPEAWTDAEHVLVRLLRFLSGDDWQLELVQDRSERPDASLEGGQVVERVALFSGGLDSFAGAILAIQADEEEGSPRIAFVSQWDNPVVAASQKRVRKWIRGNTSSPLIYRREWLAQRQKVVENTSRSRSLLFLALGVALASGSGASRLEVPENGYTSLNPPLSEDRGGPLSTRSTHPMTLWLANEVLSMVGLPVTITNPYQWMTKGELVRQAANVCGSDITGGVSETLSCGKFDGYLYKGGNVNLNCGLCVSCIVRRAAIQAAGLRDETQYLMNVLEGQALQQLVQKRRGDVDAVKALIAQGIDEDAVIGAAPLPPRYDISRGAEVCRRALEEIRGVDLP